MHRLLTSARRAAVPLLALGGGTLLAAQAPSVDSEDVLAGRSASGAPPSWVPRWLSSGAWTGGGLSLAGVACEGYEDTDEDGEGRDAEGEEEEAGSGARKPVADFSSVEDDRSLAVHVSEGLTLTLQTSAAGPSPGPPAAFIVQAQLTPAGPNAVYILADNRAPSLQAVLQPGREGKLLKLSAGTKPAPGLSVDQDVMLAWDGVQSAKTTLKYSAADFHSQLMVQPLGQGPPNADFSYHQAVTPQITAGGQVQAVLGRLLPYPTVRRIVWGTFGSWTSARNDAAVTARLAQQPQPDGSLMENLSLNAWRRASKALELGANVSVTAAGWTAPQDSSMGVGARLTFENPSGMSPTVSAHMTSNLVTSLQLQKPFAAPGSHTFMRTTLSASMDHQTKAYAWGLGVEMYS